MHFERFELERWMTRWELDVDYDIAESGILPLSLDDICRLIGTEAAGELRDAMATIELGYSEARGTLDLRTALADSYAQATPDDVLVTTGAIEANFLLFNVLLSPGDHVVTIAPSYQQLQSVPRAIGADVSLWRLDADHGFRFDLNRLHALVRPDTKLIVINSPHNPTGAMLDESELRDVLAIADRVGARVLSDEAYRWLEHPGGVALPPPLRDLSERAISVGTMSKPFGTPGLRIGWFVADRDLVDRCWGMRDYVSLSPAKLSDVIATSTIRHREAILPRNAEIIRTNLETARGWFDANSDIVSWTEPRAALLAMLRYDLPVDSMTLADGLAREARVMLAPGATFGLENHLRIGIGQRPDLFAIGLDRAAAHMRTYR